MTEKEMQLLEDIRKGIGKCHLWIKTEEDDSGDYTTVNYKIYNHIRNERYVFNQEIIEYLDSPCFAELFTIAPKLLEEVLYPMPKVDHDWNRLKSKLEASNLSKKIVETCIDDLVNVVKEFVNGDKG